MLSYVVFCSVLFCHVMYVCRFTIYILRIYIYIYMISICIYIYIYIHGQILYILVPMIFAHRYYILSCSHIFVHGTYNIHRTYCTDIDHVQKGKHAVPGEPYPITMALKGNTATSLQMMVNVRGIIPRWPYFRLAKYDSLPR